MPCLVPAASSGQRPFSVRGEGSAFESSTVCDSLSFGETTGPPAAPRQVFVEPFCSHASACRCPILKPSSSKKNEFPRFVMVIWRPSRTHKFAVHTVNRSEQFAFEFCCGVVSGALVSLDLISCARASVPTLFVRCSSMSCAKLCARSSALAER